VFVIMGNVVLYLGRDLWLYWHCASLVAMCIMHDYLFLDN
jgi:hypothetical protein